MTPVTDSADAGVEEINLAREAGFSIGPLGVSPSTREVGPAGRMESVEPRVMQVLVCLFQASGQVVSRDDLIQRCWGGRIVGEDAINRCIAKARRIADMTETPSFEIETIPRVGYRLNARVEQAPPAPAAPSPAVAARKPRRAIWLAAGAALAVLVGFAAMRFMAPSHPKPWSAGDHRMSFAVLPLTAGKDDPALADYTATLTGELTAGLSSVQLAHIVPRGTVAATDLSGGPVAVGKRLQVAYLIEGTVRRQEDHYETTLSIIDVGTGALLGTTLLSEPIAVRHEPLREDLMRAEATLAGYSGKAELDRINALPDSERDARDLVILAEKMAPGNNDGAGADGLVALTEKAQALAPEEPNVLAALADALAYRAADGWSADTEGDYRRATALIDRVFARDSRNFTAMHAQLLIFLGQQRDDEAIALAETMISINPYDRAIYFDKGIGQMRLGRNADALDSLARMPHNADDESPLVQQLYGDIYLAMGTYAEAAVHLRKAMVGLSPADYKDPNSAGTLLELAAAESLAGRAEPARHVLDDFRTANPGVTTIAQLRGNNSYFFGENPATVETILGALHKLGMAE
jgi:DNA-binding winged helix-turn-helix (wHTH) protein/TolB-like protein/tetratricopeptide (TPR) repeat protein